MNKCKHPVCELIDRKGGSIKLSGFYRIYLGTREKQKIWIVDGDKVCRELYPEFIMGGNDQRYRFNPVDDIWIDNRIAIEELEYTIAHELIERKLMQDKGWSYNRAHTEGGIATEKVMRERDARRVAARKRAAAALVAPERLHADPVCVGDMYKAFYGNRDGCKVWIVDGPRVRKDLYPDFCFGTHDLKSPFVPQNEIWLDSAMSIEEAHYAIMHQRVERKLLAEGKKWEKCYDTALQVTFDERNHQLELARIHEARLAPVSYGVRAKGVKRK
jgi:hypothetical protein